MGASSRMSMKLWLCHSLVRFVRYAAVKARNSVDMLKYVADMGNVVQECDATKDDQ
jgi:hypothetical protein